MRHPWDSQHFADGAKAAGRDPKVIAAAQAVALKIKRGNSDLPVIPSLAHLAHLADINLDMLRNVVARRDDPSALVTACTRIGLPGRPIQRPSQPLPLLLGHV